MLGGELLLTKNISNDNFEVFECGFLNINLLKIKPNYFFIIFAILLIIYDIEFFLFIPLFFNFNILVWQHY
jgi:NADH:ubiquinone oxidoreductase subunit 3 (subunit A)